MYFTFFKFFERPKIKKKYILTSDFLQDSSGPKSVKKTFLELFDRDSN